MQKDKTCFFFSLLLILVLQSCDKNFSTKVSDINLTRKSVNLVVGESKALELKIIPENYDVSNLIWSSSDEKIATVSNEGVVRGVSVGNARVIVKNEDGSKSASAVILVSPVKVDSISIISDLSVFIGSSVSLVASIFPANADNKDVKWNSSDLSKVQVNSSGVINAVALGTADIRVLSTDGSNKYAICRVTVIPIKVSSISVDKSSLSVVAASGVGKQIKINILPENATDKSVVWTSSNSSIVTVDQNGVVHGLKSGDALISVKAADGSNVSSFTDVNVIPRPPSGDISLSFNYNEHIYYVINAKKSWSDASIYASNYGGHLLSIESAVEQSEIEKKLASVSGLTDGVWIGGSDIEEEGTWIWYTYNNSTNVNNAIGKGEGKNGSGSWVTAPNAYVNWAETKIKGVGGEPNNNKNQDCLDIVITPWSNSVTKYEWDDYSCSTMLNFMIEVE